MNIFVNSVNAKQNKTKQKQNNTKHAHMSTDNIQGTIPGASQPCFQAMPLLLTVFVRAVQERELFQKAQGKGDMNLKVTCLPLKSFFLLTTLPINGIHMLNIVTHSNSKGRFVFSCKVGDMPDEFIS